MRVPSLIQASGYDLEVFVDPSKQDFDRLASLTDWPCVWSDGFMRGTANEQAEILIFVLSCKGQPRAICFATLTRMLLRTTLQLPSYPRLLDDTPEVLPQFWSALNTYCRSNRVQNVNIASFESKQALSAAPAFGEIQSGDPRREFFVDLTADEDTLLKRCSSNHRRNIRKAKKAELDCIKSRSLDDFDAHLNAFEHTKNRREARDEGVIGLNRAFCEKLIISGDAFLLQLRKNNEVMSSFLIIETPKSAFYFSGGTTEVGMKLGASQALMWEVMLDLKQRGVQTLTLGGAPDGGTDGLNRYKLGFGAYEVNANNYQIKTGNPIITACVSTTRKALQFIPGRFTGQGST